MSKMNMKWSQICLILFLTVLCTVMVLPFMWVFSTSLRLPKESFSLPPSFIPTSFHIQNYIELFTKFPFLKFITNSLFVAVTVVLLNIVITTMAGYAFSRIQFKGRDTLFVILLAGLMIPMQAMTIPVYIIMAKLKLVGSLWALILPATINPLGIFLVRQFMLTIPSSYEEAAYMDGASRIKIYLQIILPMSKSIVMMTSMLCFLTSWNNFMAPLIYLSDWEKMTIPIGLRVLQGYQGTGSISVLFAGIAISLVAPLLLYIFGQKYLVQESPLSGLKS